MTTRPKSHVGWLGAGAMGTAMCERLLGARWQVSVWNRTAARAEPLVAAGASRAATPADLATCDLVFVVLDDAASVQAALSGPEGLLTGAQRPSVIINCATVALEGATQLRQVAEGAGCHYVSAPIVASPGMVTEGAAAIVVSGAQEAFALAEPALADIAATVVFAGEAEQAVFVKMCSEVLLATFTLSLYELADAAAAAGVERTALFDLIDGSAIGSGFSRFKAQQYLAGQTTLTPDLRVFRLRSLDGFLGEAHRVDAPAPISSLVRELS